MAKYKSSTAWYNSPEYQRVGWTYDYYTRYCKSREVENKGTILGSVVKGMGDVRKIGGNYKSDWQKIKDEVNKFKKPKKKGSKK